MGALDPLINAPRQQKLIFGVMLLVIVGALGYFFLISGSRADRDTLLEENEVRRAEVLKAKAQRKQLEQAKERLPSEREIPQVYRQVSDLATQSGLGVSLFQPKAPEDRDVLSEVPIAVTAECTYHQLGAFLERVGKMPRIVSLGEFRLIGIDKPTGTVRAEMTLATYMFKAEGAPPPPVKPGAPAPPPGAAARPAPPAPAAPAPPAPAAPAPPAPAAPTPPAQPR